MKLQHGGGATGEHRRRIGFASVLIAVRALVRCLEQRPEQVARHQALISIPRDLTMLLT